MKITAALVKKFLRKPKGSPPHCEDNLWIAVGQGKTKVIHFHFYWKRGNVVDKDKVATLGADSAPKAIRDADAKYQEMLSNLRQNLTPADIARSQRRAEEFRRRKSVIHPTVNSIFGEYFENHLKLSASARTYKADVGRFNNHIKPHIGSLIADDVSRVQLQALIDGMVKTIPSQAYYVDEFIERVWKYAVRQGHQIDERVAAGLNRPDKPERNRVATEPEIRRILDRGSPIVQATLFMGQRVEDTYQMEWVDFDPENKNWLEIPEYKYKTGINHRVYITPTVFKLIAKHPRNITSSNQQWCWGGYKESHISSTWVWDRWQELKLEQVQRKSEPNNLQMRDIRRTFSTWIEKNYRYEMVGAVAGHKKIGVGRIYGRYEYETEKKDVMLAWEKYLNSLRS